MKKLFLIFAVLAALCGLSFAGGDTSPSVRELPVALAYADNHFVDIDDMVPAIRTFRIAQDPPAPGSVWSAAWLYRVTGPKDDRMSVGALNKLKTFTQVFNRWTVDLDAFGGLTLVAKAPVAGILIGARRSIANEVDLYLGAGAIIAQGSPTGLAASAGITVRF